MARKSREAHGDSDETRQVILQAARRLFFEHGYRAVTTRQVALACGLTQPALYYHFADKQDLYAAVIIQELQRTKAAYERIAKRTPDLEERLRLIAHYILSDTPLELPMMFHDIEHEMPPERQAVVGQAFDECMRQPLTAIFADGINNGVLRSPHNGGMAADESTYLFLNLVIGFLDRNADNHPKRATTDTARLIVDLYMHGLAAA